MFNIYSHYNYMFLNIYHNIYILKLYYHFHDIEENLKKYVYACMPQH